MKTVFFSAVVASVFLALTPVASANDWRISATRKKADIPKQETKKRRVTNKEESFNYEVKVTNGVFKDLPEVEARYMIFVERQKVGTKSSADIEESIRGKEAIPALKARESKEFTTKTATLVASSLESNYIFIEGGRVRTKDRLIGVWVRLFKDGEQVGEFSNPSTLASQREWKDN